MICRLKRAFVLGIRPLCAEIDQFDTAQDEYRLAPVRNFRFQCL